MEEETLGSFRDDFSFASLGDVLPGLLDESYMETDVILVANVTDSSTSGSSRPNPGGERPEGHHANSEVVPIPSVPGPNVRAMAEHVYNSQKELLVNDLANWIVSAEGSAKVLEDKPYLKGDGGPEGIAPRYLIA